MLLILLLCIQHRTSEPSGILLLHNNHVIDQLFLARPCKDFIFFKSFGLVTAISSPSVLISACWKCFSSVPLDLLDHYILSDLPAVTPAGIAIGSIAHYVTPPCSSLDSRKIYGFSVSSSIASVQAVPSRHTFSLSYRGFRHQNITRELLHQH